MSHQDDELRMLANVPIPIEGAGDLYIPLLRDIASIGEGEYSGILSMLLIDKKNFPQVKDEEGLTNFHILFINCYRNEDFWKKVKFGLELLFKKEVHMSPVTDDHDVFFYFGHVSDQNIICSENFERIQAILIAANNIKIDSEEEYNPANSKAKEFIKRLQEGRDYIAKKKQKMVSLSSKISGLAWKSNSINILNVFDMNIFQFYDALLKVEQIDHYLFTINGIYSGNVDGSKVKLDKLHWSNKT